MTSKELLHRLRATKVGQVAPSLVGKLVGLSLALVSHLRRAGCLLASRRPHPQVQALLVERVLWGCRRRCLLHKLENMSSEY